MIINNVAYRSRPDARARLGVTGESSFDNSRGIQTSGSGGAEAAGVGGICGRDGRATASVWGDWGSILIGGTLEVWPCDFGPKQFG